MLVFLGVGLLLFAVSSTHGDNGGPQQCSYEHFKGKYYSGTPNYFDVDSVDSCKTACSADPECTVFSTANGICYFFHAGKVTHENLRLIYLEGQDTYAYICNAATSTAVNPCALPLEEGSGDETLTRFYYDASKEKCRKFVFKGNDGNANNYAKMSECKAACVQFPARCKQPMDTGVGEEKIIRYFYNAKTKKCKQMKYKGNGGNENNFGSREECRFTCKVR